MIVRTQGLLYYLTEAAVRETLTKIATRAHSASIMATNFHGEELVNECIAAKQHAAQQVTPRI